MVIHPIVVPSFPLSISLDKGKLWPACGSIAKVRVSPKSLENILRGPWMSVLNYMAIVIKRYFNLDKKWWLLLPLFCVEKSHNSWVSPTSPPVVFPSLFFHHCVLHQAAQCSVSSSPSFPESNSSVSCFLYSGILSSLCSFHFRVKHCLPCLCLLQGAFVCQ